MTLAAKSIKSDFEPFASHFSKNAKRHFSKPWNWIPSVFFPPFVSPLILYQSPIAIVKVYRKEVMKINLSSQDGTLESISSFYLELIIHILSFNAWIHVLLNCMMFIFCFIEYGVFCTGALIIVCTLQCFT